MDPPAREHDDRNLELVYDALHQIAERALRDERRGHTLQPTALVHEVWLRLEGAAREDGWERERFVAHAARTARRALVDHARRRGAERRGGGRQRVTLSNLALDGHAQETVDLLALDEALEELAVRAPRQARVVELRWFAGLGFEAIGTELGVSDRTAKSDWRVARAWLARRLSDDTTGGTDDPAGGDAT